MEKILSEALMVLAVWGGQVPPREADVTIKAIRAWVAPKAEAFDTMVQGLLQ